MPPTQTLEEVLSRARQDAAVLRRNHHEHDAELIEQLCEKVTKATQDFTVWLSEPQAVLRSGHTRSWLRRRFPSWYEQGHARFSATSRRIREYRQLVIPHRTLSPCAHAAGQLAGARRITSDASHKHDLKM